MARKKNIGIIYTESLFSKKFKSQFGVPKKTLEEYKKRIEEHRKRIEEHRKRVEKYLNRIEKKTKNSSLIIHFDPLEIDSDTITQTILAINELYLSIGGDELIIVDNHTNILKINDLASV